MTVSPSAPHQAVFPWGLGLSFPGQQQFQGQAAHPVLHCMVGIWSPRLSGLGGLQVTLSHCFDLLMGTSCENRGCLQEYRPILLPPAHFCPWNVGSSVGLGALGRVWAWYPRPCGQVQLHTWEQGMRLGCDSDHTTVTILASFSVVQSTCRLPVQDSPISPNWNAALRKG